MIGPAAGNARQNEVESRQDVVVYTTPVLGQDVEVTGPVSLILCVSTSARETDCKTDGKEWLAVSLTSRSANNPVKLGTPPGSGALRMRCVSRS
jgi:predicted acyl esterase